MLYESPLYLVIRKWPLCVRIPHLYKAKEIRLPLPDSTWWARWGVPEEPPHSPCSWQWGGSPILEQAWHAPKQPMLRWHQIWYVSPQPDPKFRPALPTTASLRNQLGGGANQDACAKLDTSPPVWGGKTKRNKTSWHQENWEAVIHTELAQK